MSSTNISWAATPLPKPLTFTGAIPTLAGPVIRGYTFNPWWGCFKLSPACDGCYADEFARTRAGTDLWATNRRRFFDDRHWQQPTAWDRLAKRNGTRLRVFTASMGDIFERLPSDHPDKADMEGARSRFWDLVRQCTSLDWLLLTKRPSEIRRMLPADLRGKKHVWIGFTAETQEWFNKRWPFVKPFADLGHPIFVSIEPQLGPIQLPSELSRYGSQIMIICGGESGSKAKARPFDLNWAHSLQAQCKALGLRFHMKQFGSNPVNLPKGLRIKHPHGSNMEEWPESLRVRKWAKGIPITRV